MKKFNIIKKKDKVVYLDRVIRENFRICVVVVGGGLKKDFWDWKARLGLGYEVC